MPFWRNLFPWCRPETADTGEADPSPRTFVSPICAVRVLYSFLPPRSELRRQCHADRARLYDTHCALKARRTAARIAGDAARVSQIFAVQRNAVTIVVEADASRVAIVAGQAHLLGDVDGTAEVGAPRADIDPAAP